MCVCVPGPEFKLNFQWTRVAKLRGGPNLIFVYVSLRGASTFRHLTAGIYQRHLSGLVNFVIGPPVLKLVI